MHQVPSSYVSKHDVLLLLLLLLLEDNSPFLTSAAAHVPLDDVTSQRSFEQLSMWRDEVLERLKRQEYQEYFPMVVVGNKSDLLGSVPQDGTTGVDMDAVKVSLQ